MQIAVCEDCLDDAQLIDQAIAEAKDRLMLHMETDYYRSGEELLDAVRHGKCYPFVILDIYLEHLNGIETARRIRELLPDVQVAFATTSKDFTLNAFDLDALHYLVKPINADKVQECLARFCHRTRVPLKTLEIQSEYKTYSYPILHVQKVQSSNKGVDIYLRGAEEPQHIPLALMRVEEQLDPEQFLKISRGLIVQMSFILCIDKDVCRLKDGTEALLSRNDKSKIRKKYNDWLFSKAGGHI